MDIIVEYILTVIEVYTILVDVHPICDVTTVKVHFNEVQAALFPKLDQLFDTVRHKLPTSDNPTTDKQIYVNNARIFLVLTINIRM